MSDTASYVSNAQKMARSDFKHGRRPRTDLNYQRAYTAEFRRLEEEKKRLLKNCRCR